VAANSVIGKDNDLAWHLPSDMAFFKKTTAGRTVIMGRRNYESIPEKYRPLPGRPNIVISRNKDYRAPGSRTATSIKDALETAKNSGEQHTFIIGGGEIYRLALSENVVDDMYITHVHAEVEGDTHFPQMDEDKWQGTALFEHKADERHDHAFTVVFYESEGATNI
jgi:dihydrofolate reductase